tara:strand:+ start:1197 stop:1379 length:183 start_codon:yes stop_codon:yes gene_type:complete
MIIIENVIINFGTNEPEILNNIHIENGVVKFIDLKEQLKNLQETIEGSPLELYEQTHISN